MPKGPTPPPGGATQPNKGPFVFLSPPRPWPERWGKRSKTTTTDTKLLITQEQCWWSLTANGYHTNTMATKGHVRTSLLRVGPRLILDLVVEDRPRQQKQRVCYNSFCVFSLLGRGSEPRCFCCRSRELRAPVRWRRGLPPVPVLPRCPPSPLAALAAGVGPGAGDRLPVLATLRS